MKRRSVLALAAAAAAAPTISAADGPITPSTWRGEIPASARAPSAPTSAIDVES